MRHSQRRASRRVLTSRLRKGIGRSASINGGERKETRKENIHNNNNNNNNNNNKQRKKKETNGTDEPFKMFSRWNAMKIRPRVCLIGFFRWTLKNRTLVRNRVSWAFRSTFSLICFPFFAPILTKFDVFFCEHLKIENGTVRKRRKKKEKEGAPFSAGPLSEWRKRIIGDYLLSIHPSLPNLERWIRSKKKFVQVVPSFWFLIRPPFIAWKKISTWFMKYFFKDYSLTRNSPLVNGFPSFHF